MRWKNPARAAATAATCVPCASMSEVSVDPVAALIKVPDSLDMVTHGQFDVMARGDAEPDFVLVHDRRDGACWLWRYRFGLRFVMAQEPTLEGDGDLRAA